MARTPFDRRRQSGKRNAGGRRSRISDAGAILMKVRSWGLSTLAAAADFVSKLVP
jgi:hypothetical protein